MHNWSGNSRNVWALPIVLLLCAVMVMPAGALLGRSAAPAFPHASGATAATHSSSAGGGSGSLTPFSPLSPRSLGSTPQVGFAGASQHLPSPGLTSHAPWFANLGGGSTASLSRNGYAPLVSPPNLGLAEDPARSPAAQITPGYAAPPAPMGLADYGYGAAGAYAYNTSSFLATVNLTTPPNVTAPGSEGVIDPQGSSFGLVGSPYEFSLQLNTIGTNFTERNTSTGAVWAQNVLDINDSAIHFVDDVWNLTTNSSFRFAFNAIASGCAGANIPLMIAFEGGVYQCVGGSIPISAADYPLTIQLYNNVSVNPTNEDVLAFGYAIWGHGILLGAGDYDTIVFVNPTGVAPVNAVAFTVNGFSRAPAQPQGYPQLLEDSEVTFGGPIGGANAVFRSLEGSLALDLWTGSAFTTIPSAYNFGSDTGETAVGIAGYWNATGTEQVNQGPSFLYGLWDTSPELGVAPGAIQFQGSLNESYGFAFVSNVDPLVNQTNLSYVPTTVAGTFDSWLPPAVPALGSVYYTAAYAPGNFSVYGNTFSTNQSNFQFPRMFSSFGFVDAPIYVRGDAQATSLAYNLTARPLTATWSYNFTNLVVNLPIAFTHLNDYDFPTFVIVQAEQLGRSIVVFNVTEGSNAFGGELYTIDFALPPAVPGWLTPAPSVLGPWKNFTEQFNLWGDYHPEIVDERLNGSLAFPNVTGTQGGVVFFFSDFAAYAQEIGSSNGSFGVANIKSIETAAFFLYAEFGANALDDIGSYYTDAQYVTATESFGANTSFGVYALDSFGGYYAHLEASYGAIGFYSGADTGLGARFALLGTVGASLYYVGVYDGAVGAELAYSYDTTIYQVQVGFEGLGGIIDESAFTVVTNLTAVEGYGIDIVDSNYTALVNYSLFLWDYGSEWTGSNYISVVNASFVDYNAAVYAVGDNHTSFANVMVAYPTGDGLYLLGLTNTAFSNLTVVNASYGAAGVVVVYSLNTTFSLLNVLNVSNGAAGIAVGFSSNTSFSEAIVSNLSTSAYGLYLLGLVNLSFALVGIQYIEEGATGIWLNDSSATNFTEVEVQYVALGGTGVWVQSSNLTAFYGLLVAFVTLGSAGVVVLASGNVSFQLTTVEYVSEGAVGLALLAVNGTLLRSTEVGYISLGGIGIGLGFTNETTFVGTVVFDVSAPGDGIAVLDNSHGTSFTSTVVELASNGIYLAGANATSFSSTLILQGSDAIMVDYSNGTTLYSTYITQSNVGVALNHSTNSSVGDTLVNSSYAGIYVNASAATTISGLVATGGTLYGAFVTYSSGVSISDLVANDSLGVFVNQSSTIVASGITALYYGLGLALVNCSNASVTNVTAWYGATGVIVDPSTGVSVANVTAQDGATGVVLVASTDFSVTNVTAANGSDAVVLLSTSHGTVTTVSATNGSVGVLAPYGYDRNLVVSGLSASQESYAFEAMGSANWTSVANVQVWDTSIGVVFFAGAHDSVTNVSATNHSIAVGFLQGSSDTVSQVRVSDLSTGVVIEYSRWVTVTNVSATNATSSSPWTTGFVLPYRLPAAAVIAQSDYQVNISLVSASHYPLGLFDQNSSDLFVQGLNASFGAVGVQLNGTSYSLLSGIGAYEDTVGLVMTDNAAYNTVTVSQFVNDTGYGVDLLGGSYANLVYDNDFVGDNGANNQTYQATHIQAFSWTVDNWFNSSAKIGNFWADWHVYSGGVLAPYYVSNGAWDYHPLGAPQGKYTVTVTATGLTSGTEWTVTLGGVSQSSHASAIVFTEFPGTYSWVVSPLAGWTIRPASGSVVVSTGPVNLSVGFAVNYTVTFSESGLPGSTSWSVVLNGIEQTTTGTTIVFAEVAGTYSYTVLAPSNWAASPSTGNVSGSGSYLVPVAFTSTVVPMYTVWLNETGLSGASPTWSAYFNGLQTTGSGSSLVFSVPAGTYNYQIVSVAGYTASPSSGVVTVSGNYSLAVLFTPTYVPVTVQLHETGLPKGTAWSAYVGGILGQSTGNTINITVAAEASYLYQITRHAGYTITHSSDTIAVGSTTYLVTVSFNPLTYEVTFGEDGLSGSTVWSVLVNGQTLTSSGTSITVDLPNGSYSYQFSSVAGYTVSGASGSVTVNGALTGASVSYAPTSTPSYVAGSTFNTDWAIALGIGVGAIVLALAALLRRPRAPAPTPPEKWQEGPAETTDTGGSGGSQGPSK
jgi:Thermopsin/Periplasmic copper-binding protein (NosD)